MKEQENTKRHLHSSMVRLEIDINNIEAFKIKRFTFQYG